MDRFHLILAPLVLGSLMACSSGRPELASPPQPAWSDEEQQVGPTGLPVDRDAAAGAVERPGAVVGPRVAVQWDRRAPLPERRTEVSVTSDGEFLYLAGGFSPSESGQQASAPRTLWRYHPPSDEWSRLTDIPAGVNHTAFVHHGGRLFVLGGFHEATFNPIGNVRIYDISADRWSEGAPMPTPRGAMAFTLHADRIHLIGGNAAAADAIHDHEGVAITDDRSVNIHEAYNPATDRWTSLAPMPTPRNHLAAVSINGSIHALVGRADGDFELTTHEVYNASNDSWTAGPAVPTGRSGVAAVAVDGQLYLFGGETFAGERRTFADAERFHPVQNRWEALPPMPTARHGLGAAAYGRTIHVISGGPEPGLEYSDANERLTISR